MKINISGYDVEIDEKDEVLASSGDWHASARNGGRVYFSKTIYLHRMICDAPKNKDVDHADGDTLNCSRSNLRICSRSQNLGNSKGGRNNTSGYKGVSWAKRERKWRAYIRENGKLKGLGYYDDPKEAHEAYKQAAIRIHGEFARFE